VDPGEKLGNYEIVERVGSGAMGDVYRAVQLSMNRTVALKILPERLAGNESFVARFIREARSAGKCNHGNLIQVYDVGQADDKYYFSMEFVGGPTLQDVLKKDGPLPEADAIRHMQKIAEALNDAHSREIVHRDVKPANVLLTERGEPKLADLGLAKPLNTESEETNAGKPLGTPYYMSPEQVRGEAVDGRTDLYALGATFYHLLSGQTLFTGPNPGTVMAMHLTGKPKRLRELRPEISRGMDALVMKLVEKKASDRYQDAASLVEDLRALAEGRKLKHVRMFPETGRHRPVGARATKATMHAVAVKAPPPGRGTGLYAAVGAVPVALVMVVVFFLTRGGGDPPRLDPPMPPPEVPTIAVSIVKADPAPEEPQQDDAQPAQMLQAAREYVEKNPREYDEAVRLLTAVADADPEGECGAEAKKLIDQIGAARDGELKDLLGGIDAAVDRAMAAKNFDGALEVCSVVPLDRIAEVSREVRQRVEAVRLAGMSAIESALNEARSQISRNEPDRALAALKVLEPIRFKEGMVLAEPKVAELKERIEKLRQDLLAKARQEALAKFDAFLPQLEEMVAQGRLADARQRARSERDASAGDVRGAFEAVLEVIKALEARQEALRAALDALAKQGKETTVGTRKGPRKGAIEDVNDEAIVLAVTIRDGGRVVGQTRFTIPWSDLTPETEEKYAAAWELTDASAHAAAALLAVTRDNADEAAKALAAAEKHAIAAYLERRPATLKLGPAEGVAREAWQKIAEKAGETLNEEQAKALLAKIEEYEGAHGATQFAKSAAADIAAAKVRCNEASRVVSSEGLIGHWTFDDVRGQRILDSSGKGHYGTLSGGSWVAGKTGRALKTLGGALVAVSGPGDFGTAILEDKVVFGGSGPDVTIRSKTSVTDGRWHHVAATREMASREIKLYVDGRLEATGAGPVGRLAASERLTIGCIQKDIGYFNGAIDELQIFEFVLDEKQVRMLLAFKPIGADGAAAL
jgi:hypothetical protein